MKEPMHETSSKPLSPEAEAELLQEREELMTGILKGAELGDDMEKVRGIDAQLQGKDYKVDERVAQSVEDEERYGIR